MAETLSRLAGPVAVSSGSSTIFTGTAGHNYAIRAIRIVNPGTTAVTIKLGVNGVTDADLITPPIAIQGGAAYHDASLIVLSGTNTLQANASATGLTITLCGLDQV